jgi:hypothetical protein
MPGRDVDDKISLAASERLRELRQDLEKRLQSDEDRGAAGLESQAKPAE